MGVFLLSLLVVAADASALGAASTPDVSSPTPDPAKRRRLILLDLSTNGVSKDITRTLGEVLSTELSKRPIFEVVTAADIRAMTNVEASKQELAANCSIDDSCMAEIATALGADVIVHGSVGQLGPAYVVSVSLFDAAAAKALAREKVQADDLEVLGAKVERAAARLADFYEGKTVAALDDDEGSLGVPLLIAGAATAVAGVFALAIGGLFVSASTETLEDPDGLRAAKDRAVADYGWQSGLAVAGALVAVAGGVLAASSLVIE